ncbi:DUF2274 domain-containing protein [Bradyrhizobium sp.]
MTKLKLSTIDDDKPVKITHEVPASVYRDLFSYADYRNSQLSQSHLSEE